MSQSPDPVLQVTGLTTDIATPYGVIRAARDVSFHLDRGETLGIVGESGSGKTISVLSILGLLPSRYARITSGTVAFKGEDITNASRRKLRKLRGKELGVVFQDPMTSLNPVVTIGAQLTEAVRAHTRDFSAVEAKERAVDLLEMVGVPDATGRLDQFPHEFSGGMKQRAMIAMAIANRPSVLIADEPTTALDVTIQAQILEVLQVAQRETDSALILITHDLGVIAEMADRVLVMYAGRVVESGRVNEVFHNPKHPYTVGLLSSLPKLDSDDKRLIPISGTPPSGLSVPTGCAFHPRCALSNGRSECSEDIPQLEEVGASRFAACHFTDEVTTWRNAGAGDGHD